MGYEVRFLIVPFLHMDFILRIDIIHQLGVLLDGKQKCVHFNNLIKPWIHPNRGHKENKKIIVVEPLTLPQLENECCTSEQDKITINNCFKTGTSRIEEDPESSQVIIDLVEDALLGKLKCGNKNILNLCLNSVDGNQSVEDPTASKQKAFVDSESVPLAIVKDLSLLGGSTTKDLVRRIMYHTFSNNIGALYSYKRQKGKKVFKTLLLQTAILKAVCRQFNEATDLEIVNGIKLCRYTG
ncbi:hypothetical protein RN001_004431 [Aquatica leii]|uniref:DUF4806 domain-containing protein n=1 Tax=Aquatica leii TaxID=1421715 RepID=A0AAN7PAP1_9COLE|nr:hypothetical protein RN001_004431 [Aquatica leii]